MRNPQDTKNLLLISKYVLGHFGLTTDSNRLFRHRVLFEPNIAPEYKKIIGDAPDLRKRFKITRESLSLIDEGWAYLRNNFEDFVSHYGISYQNFIDNKVVVKKNEVKLLKLALQFYSSSADKIAKIIGRLNHTYWDDYLSVKNNIKEAIKEKLGETEPFYINAIHYDEISREFSVNYNSVKEGWGNSFRLKVEDVIEVNESFISIVETCIKRAWDYIGSNTLPKKDGFELVISCNPADIFMASTSEKWGSCINVDSDYSECYWGGLPGAIVDKNRAIVYITNGEKKEYRGIVVDRFISRSFLLTARSRSDKRTVISVVKEYPIYVNFVEMLSGIFNGEITFDRIYGDSNFVSRYFFEAMYHDLGSVYYKLCNIYLDNTKVKFPRRNKTYAPMQYCYHKFSGNAYPDIAVHKDFSKRIVKNEPELYFDFCDGLTGLIQRDKSLEVENYRVQDLLYA